MATDTLKAPTAAGSLACAECGDKDATGYVITILDTSDAKHTRTEICLDCEAGLTD